MVEVSVIMPIYNSEKFLEETVLSVLNQTSKNFELLVVDDCSSDCSYELIKEIALNDSRIRTFQLKCNSGAAEARNKALSEAKGRFITFIDADDLWDNDKIEKQLSFMKDNSVGFSCTSYRVIDEDGNDLNKKIHMKKKVDYHGFLANNLLQTVGIMVDTNQIGKNLIKMPNLRRRQDAATWLQILKQGNICYGMPDVLASYRRVKGSLSSNKIKAVSGVWYMYRNVEELPVLYSGYIFVRYALLAVWKRLYIKA